MKDVKPVEFVIKLGHGVKKKIPFKQRTMLFGHFLSFFAF